MKIFDNIYHIMRTRRMFAKAKAACSSGESVEEAEVLPEPEVVAVAVALFGSQLEQSVDCGRLPFAFSI